MLQLLEKVEAKFSKEYKTIIINGQRCFVGDNGTISYFVVLEQFRCLLVEYADNMASASAGLFEDGDLIEIDQDFDALLAEAKAEIQLEVA